MTTADVLAILLGTLGAVAYSWRSFRHPRSHGVPRFFAFECILGLFVFNIRSWFEDPTAPRQLLSWLLLAASLVLAYSGFGRLRRHGSATAPAPDSPLHRFEHTSVLVTTGPYRWIRHPLYAALLYLAWGVALKSASMPSLGLAVLASAFLLATAKIEEEENGVRFGASYREYMRRTKRFLPWLW